MVINQPNSNSYQKYDVVQVFDDGYNLGRSDESFAPHISVIRLVGESASDYQHLETINEFRLDELISKPLLKKGGFAVLNIMNELIDKGRGMKNKRRYQYNVENSTIIDKENS